MRIFIDLDVLKWLSNVLSIDQNEFVYTLNNNGKCEVRSNHIIEDISMGITMGLVLKSIKGLNPGILVSKDNNSSSNDRLDLLKKIRSGGAKLYNWNILFDQLDKYMSIKIDKGTII